MARDQRDTTDTVDAKLRRAVDWVQTGYDDRWPSRDKANTRSGEYRPLDDVSRGGERTEYRKYPNAR